MAFGAILIVGLDVIAARDEADSFWYLRRRTISHHALGLQRWVFDSAVVLLAAGSLAVLAALLAAGIARKRSAAAYALAAWCAGLLLVALFQKHDWSVGPSLGGYVHWAGTLLAFLSLPAAAILLARPWLWHGPWRVTAWSSLVLGVTALLCFLPVVFAIAVHLTIGTSWWQVVPLGLVERVLAIVEVVAVLVMGRWARSAACSPAIPLGSVTVDRGISR